MKRALNKLVWWLLGVNWTMWGLGILAILVWVLLAFTVKWVLH